MKQAVIIIFTRSGPQFLSGLAFEKGNARTVFGCCTQVIPRRYSVVKKGSLGSGCFFEHDVYVVLSPGFVTMDGRALDQLGFQVLRSKAMQTFKDHGHISEPQHFLYGQPFEFVQWCEMWSYFFFLVSILAAKFCTSCSLPMFCWVVPDHTVEQ